MLQDVLSKNLRPARRRQLVDQVREVCKASVKFRAECLNTHWFLTLDDARHKMEHWRRDYNEVRPHSALGNKPPISLMNGSSASPPL